MALKAFGASKILFFRRTLTCPEYHELVSAVGSLCFINTRTCPASWSRAAIWFPCIEFTTLCCFANTATAVPGSPMLAVALSSPPMARTYFANLKAHAFAFLRCFMQ